MNREKKRSEQKTVRVNRENEEIAEDRKGEVRAENHEDNIVVEIYDFEYDSDDSDNEQDECENEREKCFFMQRNKRFIFLFFPHTTIIICTCILIT